MVQITANIATGRLTKRVCTTILICATAFCTGCAIPSEQAYVTDVDPLLWQDPAEVTLTNSDTTTLYDLHIFLRSNQRFVCDTLPLRISILTPDSIHYAEHFRFTRQQSASPAALTCENDALYRRRIRLARTGDYRVTISPTMATPGIEAVGIHLVKSK